MNTRRQLSAIGWSLAVLVLVSAVCQIIAITGILLLELFRCGNFWTWIASLEAGGLDAVMDPNLLMLFTYGAMYPVALPVFYLMMRRIPAWQKTKKERLSVGELVAWMIFCQGLSFFGTCISNLVMYLLGQSTGLDPVQDMVSSLNLPVMILVTVIVAPIVEELIFRKLLLDRIVMFGQWRAIVFSGLMFGLFHGNFYQFFYAAALGMVFAYLYTKTGRITYCIGFHMIFNFAGSVIPMLLMQLEAGITADVLTIAWMVIYYGCTAASLVLGIVFVRHRHLFGQLTETNSPGFWKYVLTAPGMLAFFLLQSLPFLAGMVL